jgi:hypothetical protein
MGQVIEVKPNVSISLTKPNNSLSIDKPSMVGVSFTEQEYLETRNIRIGEPMGLLLILTYPNSFSFIAKRN